MYIVDYELLPDYELSAILRLKKLGETVRASPNFLSLESLRDRLSYFFLVFLAVDLLVTDFFAPLFAEAFRAAGFLPRFAPVVRFLAVVFLLVTGIHTPPFLSAMAVHVKSM